MSTSSLTCSENVRSVWGVKRDEIIAAKVHAKTTRPSVTKAGLAHQLGISRGALQRRLDSGGWKYDELERLARALDMTVDQLVSDETDTTVTGQS